MTLRYVIVQQPPKVAQLFLLYHAVGDNPDAMGEIGSWFAKTFPAALVVSVGSPGPGGQWFSEAGLHDKSEQQCVNASMPQFVESVRHWQQQSGISPEATALVGFSQGGSMVLEGIKAHNDLAGRAVVFSGRFITLPESASTRTTVHLIHGDYDDRVPLAHAHQAEQRLTALGGDVTLNVVDDLAHAIDHRSMNFALHHLQYTVPKRYFDEALGGAKPGDDDVIMTM
ncbi:MULTISPECIES: esterase [Pantoea]|uniref:Esterase n=2 Tax=Pantoea stewartii TaxID=66269 RepID=H3RG13_PANSE|nr:MULTISPECIES: esterase [Pantoea]KKW50581.1 hydrolase [Pantoea ananatis]ARF49232.1 esterase [Pantoea stewartii subsp. stewartii DC283]EHT99628.1 putative hydrolase [Pantoea stewartii subsp. stewartii DC283]KAB0553424.1 esterase [Pantoea stewartii subsp. stewartii]KGD83053.1 hydrolase [Pantoea stewartii subsp. indologenes]